MKTTSIDGNLLKIMLESAALMLEENKEEVNSLNVFPVPDGDTGTNMLLTIKSALKQGLQVDENNASKVALAASQGSLMGARGNSGVILSQLFRGLASGIGENEKIDSRIMAEALKRAADTAYKAVMKPTEGTILTVARECGERAMEIYDLHEDLADLMEEVIKHGNDVLKKTPDMLPVLKQAGVVDAGGKGLIYIFLGALQALKGETVVTVPRIDKISPIKEAPKRREYIETDDIKFGYCTEFMINTINGDAESFRDELAIFGDSLLVVGGEGLIKVHVHTNNPGQVLEKALLIGELSDIKIDNMRYQHEEVLLKDELNLIRDNPEVGQNIEKTIEKQKYSVIAISVGEGIDRLFKDLNVDVLVPGGQTMNPSTEDIISAIDKTNGDHVIILPNNSNIILAAQQAKTLSDRSIIVIPTKTIPQGIAALLAMDPEKDPEYNVDIMSEAIKNVITGQVTFAVRDTEFNGTEISKGDIIGLSDKDILSAGTDINEVSKKLIDKLMDEDKSIITLMYGDDISEETANELADLLTESYPDIDIEVIHGDQPLYYYIFAIE
ncbi:DAK2 domain-containing protein [Gudongella oleilytica]|uniref:DAK2 domain-containing protein n=1 Tax=Gudongella oleilytica TaxID=1582259 RepID=UPI002A36E7CF|nr:DAK2 domain-containing protein [Gudongella oleilytica]MDY0256969.1 DAK2 domain-containing protein [Gudongella oleilytica]HMM69791.1 DAK2 domain-containing protein [Gudongella oleilytica]